MNKKNIRTAIFIVTVIVLTLAIALLRNRPGEKEIARLKQSIALTFPSHMEVLFSEGLGDNWFGEGSSFFVYQVSEDSWDEFIKDNDFSLWSTLPIKKDFILEAKKFFWLSDEAEILFIECLNEESGYFTITNWNQLSNPDAHHSIGNDKVVIYLIAKETRRIYYYTIDL